jgi:F0F1-type ATP synthase membrane subunit b/b'
MSKILDARRLRIENSLNRADELKAESNKVRQDFETFLSTARTQAHENVMQMIHKVTVTSTQRKKDLNALMLERIQSSEDRLLGQKKQALSDIKDIAETIAIMTVEKLIDQKIDPKKVETVMNELFRQKVA